MTTPEQRTRDVCRCYLETGFYCQECAACRSREDGRPFEVDAHKLSDCLKGGGFG